MKQRWLYVLLVLSLAVNAGVLGFYGVREYRGWRRFQRYASKWFKPGTSLRQLDRLLADLQRSRAPYLDTIRTAKRELGMIALEPSPDSAWLNAALDQIARATRSEHRLMREYMRGFGRQYRPEKQEFWRNRAKVQYDSVVRAESSMVARPQEGR